MNIEQAARRVDDAARYASAIEQMGTSEAFQVEDAYRIQRASIALREARGERTIGIKLGFTSRAKMIQMGVDSLIWGWLTDAMLEEEGAPVDLARFIHPRVEPEVCFLTKRDIDRPLTALEALGHLEAVAPAMEIIDSRYQAFRFTLEDVIADNCSSAGLVVGAWSNRFDVLRNAGVLMRFDGRDVQVGSTAAILGDPLRSIVQASRVTSEAEVVLPAGSLIMAGAATAAQALRRGLHVQCVVSGIGQAEFTTQHEGGHVNETTRND
ncbi:fumarylacetoacetate hydrolase family protein [Paraburkholderia sp. CNPSo 3272]|uniref:2-keto-4-pentenoate hydratase n=1 Tax=Paraburkholderia sp. CNPSo 3272 TaxID=2940931 RepID=UPI0020B65967|nr:fumarylacetoacetate hydrolase family protein [Paraburkholderia sp. CNPSo 3272]MCP3728100.1 fumarylacetoacetate hydrolase family protein [Paraburkholderia sp. CNPSo 3272]